MLHHHGRFGGPPAIIIGIHCMMATFIAGAPGEVEVEGVEAGAREVEGG